MFDETATQHPEPPYGVLRRRATEIAAHHGIEVRDILSRDRRHDVSRARQHLMFVLVRQHGWSLCRAGRRLGRDHTTIMHGVRRHAERMEGKQ